MKRRFVTLFFLLMLAVAFVPPRQDQPDLTLSVSAGYNRYYRQGQWVPLRVYVSNSGGDLNGYIRVRTGDSGSLEETTYRTPIDLPRGARKQVFLYVSLDNFTDNLQVEVVDRGGHVVKRESTGMLTARAEDILYAVVTESPFGAVDLTALIPGTGDGHQTNWRMEDIPALADALSGLDVIHVPRRGYRRSDRRTASRAQRLGVGGRSSDRGGRGFMAADHRRFAGSTPSDAARYGADPHSVAPLADYLHLSPESLDGGMTATDSEPLPIGGGSGQRRRNAA